VSTIYLVELTGKQGGTTTVFRYCTGTGFTTQPTDAPANTWYEGRVIQPLLFDKSCHGGVKTFGLAGIGYGTMELINADGGLDALVNYGFDGQTLSVLQGDDGAARSTFTPVFSGTMDQLAIGPDKCSVRVRDVLQNLDVALQTAKFAGSNVLPAGLEGTASDLKGKPKPVCLGWNFNFAPPQVNTSRLIYQLHYQGFFSCLGPPAVPWSVMVYDKRAPITAGSEKTLAQFGAGATLLTFTVNTATDVVTTAVHGYSSGEGVSVLSTGGTLPAPLSDSAPYFARVLSTTTFTLHPTKADALANTNIVNITTAGSGALDISNNRTALGCYDWCNDALGGFYIRLGSRPLGQVTCDAVNPSLTGGAWQLGLARDLFRVLIALGAPGQPVNVFLPEPTYDNVTPAYTTGGVYIDQETTVLEALRPVLDSGGYYIQGVSFGSVGASLVTMGRLGFETNIHLTLIESDVLALELVTSQDTDRGIPAWRVNLRYKRNHTTMSRDQLAGSVSEADVAFCAQEWRTVTSEDASVKVTYPNSPELNVDTVIGDDTEAANVAAMLRLQYSHRHDFLRAKVAVSKVAGLQLGQKASLTHSRFNLAAGGTFWILGLNPNHQEATADVLLWR
jgi:hypothetical protein